MKKLSLLIFTLMSLTMTAEAKTNIVISTDNTQMVMQVKDNGRLYQTYIGERLADGTDLDLLDMPRTNVTQTPTKGNEMYPVMGTEDYFEPAMEIHHADGNATSVLKYVSHSTKNINGGTETVVRLKDDLYPVFVTLHFVAFAKENIIKEWTEISHHENGLVSLGRYASSMLYFEEDKYFLTEFHSDWAKEMQMAKTQLVYGKKVIDTRLGTRAAMFSQPFFEIGLGSEATENSGKVLMGTIGWTGNFRFTFDVDHDHELRVISGINPDASTYLLKKGEVFKTPEFIFTLSTKGIGEGSRNFQRWAMKYQLRNGEGDRYTLLNNWENTYFDFDEAKLTQLFKEAKDLGVDLFLLDDGWFGNKYPRKDDGAGLGDWQVTKTKLPNGIPYLVKAATEAGVKFGIWIEPEMVNPKSELAEKHPDWLLRLPNRETYYYRNQLVLDMSNPKVQDHVYGVIDNIMKSNPDVAYFKWDCNSPITNIYSPYLGTKQGNLYIDYVRGLYKVMRRLKQNYPNLPLMLCSGGGGRCDYEALKYFTEFWCSDDTDPYERLYIQYSLSKFFPAKAMCAHVTDWNRSTSVKFRTDVASMCKLGFDIDLKKLSKDEFSFVQQAVKNWNTLKPVILEGSQYRLISPYESNHAAFNYVSKDKSTAVLFVYDLHPRFSARLPMVKMNGLDSSKKYSIEEINLMPGQTSNLDTHATYSGDYLMKVGLDVLSNNQAQSRVIKITAM